MGNAKTVTTVHGKSKSIEVRERERILAANEQYLRDADTKEVISGSFRDRGRAVEVAEKRAGKT